MGLTAANIEQVVAMVPGGARNIQDIYPLAPLQEGILFHHLSARVGDPYLTRVGYRFKSRERLDAFLAALQAVIDRHDILRTSVLWEELPEPVQVVWRHAPLVVEEIKLDEVVSDVVRQLYKRFDPRQYRLDVRTAPLLRAAITHDVVENCWAMVLLLHHLAIDHTTLEVLTHEIQAHLLDNSSQLPSPQPFRNFVAQGRLGISREEHEAFFRQMLEDVDEPTIPFGLTGVHGDGSGIVEARRVVDATLAERLRSCSRGLNVSAASVFHLAFARVLAAVSGRDDVVFGTVLFGRMQVGEGAERMLGLLNNTLPVRIPLDDTGVQESVRRVHVLLAQLLHHEHASLALAQRCSAVAAPAPLFSALLNYRHSTRNAKQSEADIRAWEGIEQLGGEERTSYPFTLLVDDTGEEFVLGAQVQAPLDSEHVCELMHTTLANLVTALERTPDMVVRKVDVLSALERHRLLVEWNDTARTYPTDSCIHELFEAQVAKNPHALAVAYEDGVLTYEELNIRANRLAHHLREIGVRPETRVALCLERSLEMIVAVLAVLKAGGAYVPLDPSYPIARLEYLLHDSKPLAVLTHEAVSVEVRQVLCVTGARTVDLRSDAHLWEDAPEQNPELLSLRPENLAYVIYTSGSTGQPKGVMVEHKNVVRLFSATADWFHFSGEDVWTLFHSIAFDFSVWEIWGSLVHGARLVVVPYSTSRDPQAFYELVCRAKITVMNQTPSAFGQFIAASLESSNAHSLRHVIFGGESLDSALLTPWWKYETNQQVELTNMYGITETTVHVTCHKLELHQRHGGSSIGRHLPDLRIYILDACGEPVPIGVAGELYIGGAGVARGYLNRPELTAERFITSPFLAGDRLYKTGDIGRYYSDGTIEFLGRNDFQVKLRGFRIELGEIEARMRQCVDVRDVIVLAREDTGEMRLVAYYTAPDADGIPIEKLRAHMSAALPEYMVPAAYVRLESLPLTPNGKLDRKGLPVPGNSAYSVRAYEAPVGEVEQSIAQIWREVLKVDQVGRDDNFFELGGHSLIAVRLLSRLREGGLHADIRTLFSLPILRDLAANVIEIGEARL